MREQSKEFDQKCEKAIGYRGVSLKALSVSKVRTPARRLVRNQQVVRSIRIAGSIQNACSITRRHREAGLAGSVLIPLPTTPRPWLHSRAVLVGGRLADDLGAYRSERGAVRDHPQPFAKEPSGETLAADVNRLAVVRHRAALLVTAGSGGGAIHWGWTSDRCRNIENWSLGR